MHQRGDHHCVVLSSRNRASPKRFRPPRVFPFLPLPLPLHHRCTNVASPAIIRRPRRSRSRSSDHDPASRRVAHRKRKPTYETTRRSVCENARPATIGTDSWTSVAIVLRLDHDLPSTLRPANEVTARRCRYGTLLLLRIRDRVKRGERTSSRVLIRREHSANRDQPLPVNTSSLPILPNIVVFDGVPPPPRCSAPLRPPPLHRSSPILQLSEIFP